ARSSVRRAIWPRRSVARASNSAMRCSSGARCAAIWLRRSRMVWCAFAKWSRFISDLGMRSVGHHGPLPGRRIPEGAMPTERASICTRDLLCCPAKRSRSVSAGHKRHALPPKVWVHGPDDEGCQRLGRRERVSWAGVVLVDQADERLGREYPRPDLKEREALSSVVGERLSDVEEESAPTVNDFHMSRSVRCHEVLIALASPASLNAALAREVVQARLWAGEIALNNVGMAF